MDGLPLNLKHHMAVECYKDIYQQLDFLRHREKAFIAWICPHLNERTVSKGEYLQYAGGKFNNIYFIMSGECAYVMREYSSVPFLKLVTGTNFGAIDIVAACLTTQKI